MIKVENLYYKYKKQNKNNFILNDINLEISSGEFVSIIGNNGEGKSTLVKLLSGILLPTTGNIYINDLDTKSKKDFINIRKNISIVFQNPENQIIFERVYEELEFTLKNLQISKDGIEKQIDHALELTGMKDFKYANTSELSLGQKQKIVISEALAINTEIIVLDEPTAMLDPISKKEIMKLLSDLNKLGKTIIIVTHNLDEIFYSTRCLYLKNNIIENDFNIEELFTNKELLNKINNNNSNFILNILSSLLEKNINLNYKDFKHSSLTFDEYLNNEIINKL